MKPGRQSRKWLEKKAKRGARGYPIGTIAFYGPEEKKGSAALRLGSRARKSHQ
jgi:hypothetical protein